jgi:gamma-carbonic anhydrase
MPLYSHPSGVPVLGRDVFVAATASVIGDVVLGESSSVWFGAVIRGDVFPVRIGARTNIQDNAVVHVTGGKAATTMGDDVTVGHLALIHGATVGSRCLIGMGAIVLDGAVLEDECLVGAGALVPPGARIAARTLVLGRPARMVRTLKPADLEEIRSASDRYVTYAREFIRDVKLLES